MATKNLGRVGFVPKGAYDPSATYNAFDVLSWQGASYVVREDGVKGVTPGTDADKYLVLVDNAAAVAANAAAAAANEAAENVSGDVADIKSSVDKSQAELASVEGRVLNEVQLPNDFIPGRYLSNGFANNANYCRNRNAYPPGKYEIGPYTANSFGVVEYISDTQGNDLIGAWTVSKHTLTITRPFYITFNGITTAEKLAAVNADMIVKRLATEETLEDRVDGVETRVPASPEQFGAKGDGETDDTAALAAMFAAGHGDYLLTGTYALSAAVDISGRIHGGGTVKALGAARINGLFNLTGDAEIDGIIFDCACDTDFQASDYGNSYNVAIMADSTTCALAVKNCTFINGYTVFIMLHLASGRLEIGHNHFRADGVNNQWTGYMIYMLSMLGTEPIRIHDNTFIGNGTATANFAGIFMSGITQRTIDIGGNLFNGVGRDKTGGHQSHCIDAYWDVSHLYVHDNIMLNNAYCCLRIHGGSDFVVQNNVFGDSTALVSDSCILIQDDVSSTGATQMGVSDVRIENNTFKSSIRFTSAIQLTSTASNGAGVIKGVTISGNTIDGNYPYAIIFDGSVSNMAIDRNLIISPTNAIQLRHDGVLFQSDRPVSITGNALTSAGGSVISSSGALGNPKLVIARNSLDGYLSGVNLDQAYQNTSAMDNIITITRPGESYGTKGVAKVARNLIEMVNAASAISGAAAAYGNYVNGELIT